MNEIHYHHEKAIYNQEDTRINPYDLSNQNFNPSFASIIQKQAESVACMIKKNLLVKHPTDKTYSLPEKMQSLAERVEVLKGFHPFGEEENFCKEPVAGSWTGFLVEDNVLLTCAHCICQGKSNQLLPLEDIEAMRIVFGFQMTGSEHFKRVFEAKDVYQIKRIIRHEWSRGEVYADWALLELDQTVLGRQPLKLNFSKILSGNLYMLGHPSGLPIKFAGKARVIKADSPYVIESDLCAFAGNSGSPVFRTDTKEVVAILTAGNADYTVDYNYKGRGTVRSRTQYIDSVENGAEVCQRISVLNPLKTFINDKLNILEAKDGLNLPSECSSIGCSTYGTSSFIHKQFGKFDLGKQFYQSTCMYCEKNPEIIHSIVLKNCVFQYEGIDPNKNEIKKEDQITETLCLNLTSWKFFKITVEPLIH